jgi:hypothetical protein
MKAKAGLPERVRLSAGLGRARRPGLLRMKASMGPILRLNLPELDSDLRAVEITVKAAALNAEAKVQAIAVEVKPPRRRRAEQPAKAGTFRNRGVSDEAMIQRPNVLAKRYAEGISA